MAADWSLKYPSLSSCHLFSCVFAVQKVSAFLVFVATSRQILTTRIVDKQSPRLESLDFMQYERSLQQFVSPAKLSCPQPTTQTIADTDWELSIFDSETESSFIVFVCSTVANNNFCIQLQKLELLEPPAIGLSVHFAVFWPYKFCCCFSAKTNHTTQFSIPTFWQQFQ